MSINELTARVYEYESLRNKDGTLKLISENEAKSLICKNAETSKQAAKYKYDRIRTVGNGIINILKNYSTDFPIKIYAPLIECDENGNARYIDEAGMYCERPVFKDKLIFLTYGDMTNYINGEIKRRKALTQEEKLTIEKNITDNSIDLSIWDIKSKTAFPEISEWKIYYQQAYTDTEAFVILSSVINQINIKSEVINEIVRKLVRSTNDRYFEEFVKTISLEAFQTTVANDCFSGKSQGDTMGSDVFHNIKEIMRAIAAKKKINFERIYYSCDYEKKQWTLKNPYPDESPNQDGKIGRYSCTPVYIFIAEGRYWLLAVRDSYNTPNGDFMPCPLDLIKNITVSDEDACTLDEIQFTEKYDDGIEKKRLYEYMKTNFEKPEEFDVKLYKNQTSGNLVLQTFGNDFTYITSTDDYDVIRVIRSPFGIINWALVNSRDAEIVPKEENTKKRLLQRIEELGNIYR